MKLEPGKFLAGDPDTIRAFRNLARSWVRRSFHKPSQIEAVIQDAMVEMLSKLAAGDEPDPDRVEVWILGCANNAARREKTRTRREATVAYESGLHADDHTSPSEIHRARADLQHVDAVLQGSKERLTRMFLLRVQGHTHDEIAEAVNSSPGATRMALSRFRHHLEDQLLADGKLNLAITPTKHTNHHDDSSSRRV